MAPICKRRHSDSEFKYGSSKTVAVDASKGAISIVKQTGDIFKLDIDCYEEAFDYLPIEDLVSVGKTCKRLQAVAGYCFQENYLGYANCEASDGIQCKNVDVEHFTPFIRHICTDAGGFWYVIDARSQLRRMKKFCFKGMKRVHLKHLLDISMPKLEVFIVEKGELSDNFHELIDHYPKVKRLSLDRCKGSFNLIDRKYFTLEYLKIESIEGESIVGIPEFLELNPNIRKFAASVDLLWENRDKFMSANIKLDDLAIYSQDYFDDDKPVCNLLNALHERGFHKKLQLYFSSIEGQEEIDELVNFKGLVKLYIEYYSGFALSGLNNLEELYSRYSDRVADLDMLPQNLINLKRIHFACSRMDDILPFIAQSVKMQIIEVSYLRSGIHFNAHTGIINLLALNREREQLPYAQKITLYVDEKIYLATKWAMKETDFGLIRLKRNESYDWDHDFSLSMRF